MSSIFFSAMLKIKHFYLFWSNKYIITTFYDTQNRSKGFNRTSGGRKGSKSKDVQKLIIPSNRIKLGQYDLDGNLIEIYNSMADCCRELNINRANLKKGIKNKGMMRGFMFSKSLKEKIEPYINNIGQSNNLKCYVFDINGILLTEHESMSLASKYYGFTQKQLSHTLQNEGLLQKKYYVSKNKDFKLKIRVSKKTVYVYENDILKYKFETITKTSDFFKIRKQTIMKYCTYKEIYKKLNLLFSYEPLNF